MSIRGEVNKVKSDFEKGIRRMAQKGQVDSQGSVWGTQKITGYVCNVHGFDDEDESLRGTVDVQDWEHEAGEDKIEGAGWHGGVLVSAIQENKSGVYVMPSLYSDVVIVQNPFTLEEYVIKCSHVDEIQMQSHKTIKVGVVETQDFDEDDDNCPDIDDLEETGNASITEYDKEKIVHTVKTKDGQVIITQTADTVNINAKDSVITIKADGSIDIKAKTANVTVDNGATMKCKTLDITADTSANITSQATEIKEGTFTRKGVANVDGTGGFCGIPVCPFTGAVHVGSVITA